MLSIPCYASALRGQSGCIPSIERKSTVLRLRCCHVLISFGIFPARCGHAGSKWSVNQISTADLRRARALKLSILQADKNGSKKLTVRGKRTAACITTGRGETVLHSAPNVQQTSNIARSVFLMMNKQELGVAQLGIY